MKAFIILFDFLAVFSIGISIFIEESLLEYIKVIIKIGGGCFLSIALGLAIFSSVSHKQIDEKNNELIRITILHILFLFIYESYIFII